MKIADVCEFYSENGGGVRTYIRQKLAAGARAGVSNIIIAPGAEDREEPTSGGKIVWVKAPKHPLDSRYHVFWDAEPVHKVLDREAPDVVEGSSAWRGGWIAARWPGPAIKSFFIHQDPVAVYPQTLLRGVLRPDRIDQLFGWFWAYMRKLSARFDVSVVSGHWLAERLAGFGLDRPVAVPFGIDGDAFSPLRRSEAVRRAMLAECGVTDPNAALLVAVSRHHPEKRLGTLFKALRRLQSDRAVGLYVIGDGPIRSWVEGQAAKTPGVFIAGNIWDRAELANKLASADAMLHGGAAETYGLVVAEALASGLPLIVPDQGGAADLAGPDYAELYAAGDAAACAAAVSRMLARDRGLVSRAALEGARKRLRRPEDHFQELFSVYARLVEDRFGGRVPGYASVVTADAA
ncbi:MAG: glycosyltransferase [Maricaulaceae bacterium]